MPVRLGYWLFSRLGLLSARFGRSYAVVWDNMTHVLGADADVERRRRAVSGIFSHQGMNYYDLFRLPALSDEQIAALVTVQGLEHLEAALALGRGVIIVSIHFGNVEVTAHALALRGYPILAVMEHLQPERLHRYFCAMRARRGIRIISADSLLKPIYRALRSNEIVGLVADRDTTQSGVVTEFFGAPARLPDGYAQLAARTGAALVPCFGLRHPGGRFEVCIEPPVIREQAGGLGRDASFYMDSILETVEKYIARNPEQWVMFQPIWQLADEEVGAG